MTNRTDNLYWFHGNLSRENAEKLIKQGNVDGTFLVRESSTAPGDFVLTLLYQGDVVHYQIRRHGEDAFFSIDAKEQIMHGLETLVEYYQQDSLGLVCKLTVPIKKDPPPHNTRSHGVTNLLHRATKQNDAIVVSEMLKCGYRNFDAKNQDGQTALHLAALHCNEEILKLLLDAGVNPNSMDTFGYQPLHYACRAKQASFIRILIQSHANIQGRNIKNGHVPLHEAAKYGNLEAVKELLAVQAPFLPRTNFGEFPFDLAREAGQTEVEKYLLNYELPPACTYENQWYHGTLTREEAVKSLEEFANEMLSSKTAPDDESKHIDTSGCFLVRYSDSRGGAGHVLTLLSGDQAKNFRISQASLAANIAYGEKTAHFKFSKYLYIDDGPYWPSLEHLIEHFMRFSYGLPVSLKYPVPPKPKPQPPSFATIPRDCNRKNARSGCVPKHLSCVDKKQNSPVISPKKKLKERSSSVFNTLNLNSLRKRKPPKIPISDNSNCARQLSNEEELKKAEPLLRALSFSTDFHLETESEKDTAIYNVPKNNSMVAMSLLYLEENHTKSDAEAEYLTKSDMTIQQDVFRHVDRTSKETKECLDAIISVLATEGDEILFPLDNLKFFIPPDQLHLDSVIGEGEFGSVYKGSYSRCDSEGNPASKSSCEVAIKTLRDIHCKSSKKEFLREAAVMIDLKHHCIVQLIGISRNETLMMVQELVPLGSMLNFILENKLSIRAGFELKLWASQIACGMNYLEGKHFVHRDLAARNILLASRNQAKISDFGLSRALGADNECYQASQGGRWPIKWYAPESFNNGIFSHASDVWSFGVTLWEMFSLGEAPYENLRGVEAIQLIENGERLSQPCECPNHIYEIMKNCWNYKPRDRPSFRYLAEYFAKDPDYQNILDLVQNVHID